MPPSTAAAIRAMSRRAATVRDEHVVVIEAASGSPSPTAVGAAWAGFPYMVPTVGHAEDTRVRCLLGACRLLFLPILAEIPRHACEAKEGASRTSSPCGMIGAAEAKPVTCETRAAAADTVDVWLPA